MDIFIRYKKYIILSVGFIFLFIFVLWYVHNNNNQIELEDNTTLSVIPNEQKITTSTNNKFYIDIKGAVKKPGVYEVSHDDKVIDAIKLAGGLSKNAVTNNINLSQKLKSEMVIYIFTKNELTTKLISNYTTIPCKCETIEVNNCIKEETTTKNIDNPSNNKININIASINELTTLSGIGESKAKAIITYREENNGFKSIDEIKNVSGLGESLFEKIKDNITV